MTTIEFLFVLVAIVHSLEVEGQVISEPDDVTVCEGREAVFTCVLNSNIRSDDVQWYRFIKNTSTTIMVDPNGENIYFITDTTGNATNSSLTITNVIKSFAGYFWVGTSSLTVCNASLTVLASPPALTVTIIKSVKNSSFVVQWDAVDDSLTTTYTVTWTRAGGGLQVATLTEQTSYAITGLTFDTVYTITVTAANTCGSAPEFSTSIILSTNATSNTSSISPTVIASTSPVTLSMPTSISSSTTTTTTALTMNNTSTTVTVEISSTSITPHMTTIISINPIITTAITTTATTTAATTSTIIVNDTSIAATTSTIIVNDTSIAATISSLKFSNTAAISTAAISTANTTAVMTSVTTTTNPANSDDTNSDSGSNVAYIIAAVIGGIFLILILFFIISCAVYYIRKHGNANNSDKLQLRNVSNLVRHPNDDSVPPLTNFMMTYDEEPYHLRNKTLPDDNSDDVTPYAYADIGYNKACISTFQPSHLPNEPVNPSNNRSASQNEEVDDQRQSMVEYAVVDRKKKKSRKLDKEQSVYDTDTGDGVQHISVPTISVTGNDDRSSSEAVKSRNDPSLHYADLHQLPASTGMYATSENPATVYAHVS